MIDVLQLARKAAEGRHAVSEGDAHSLRFDELERFAALVAAAEREECAKVCEYRAMALDYSGNQYVRDHAALDCARSIRARGNT